MTGKALVVGLALLIVATAGSVLADGGFFPDFAGSAESVDQRAVLIHEDGKETLIIQTAHDGTGEGDFAWVIPTPAQVKRADVSEGNPRAFDELYWLTEPRAYSYGGRGMTGCGGGGGEAGAEQYAGVNVWDEFVVGDYDVAVLSAEESDDLATWLNANGYRAPDPASGTLAYYVGKNWFFLALKIRSDKRLGDNFGPPGAGSGAEGFKPLQVTFNSPQMVFPMRISSVSTTREICVLLYIFAAHRMEGVNYATTQVKAGADWDGKDFPKYYEGKFREALAQVGPAGLVTEFAGKVDDWWVRNCRDVLPLTLGREYFLTRFRTYLQPADMQDDILFATAASDNEFNVMLASADSAESPLRLASWGFLLIGAVACSVRGNRRERWGRAFLLCLALAVLVL